jgi:hypothetical protein
MGAGVERALLEPGDLADRAAITGGPGGYMLHLLSGLRGIRDRTVPMSCERLITKFELPYALSALGPIGSKSSTMLLPGRIATP